MTQATSNDLREQQRRQSIAVEATFYRHRDLFTLQPADMMQRYADVPERLYCDGERDFVRIKDQLYSYYKDAVHEAMETLTLAAQVEEVQKILRCGGEISFATPDEPDNHNRWMSRAWEFQVKGDQVQVRASVSVPWLTISDFRHWANCYCVIFHKNHAFLKRPS